MGEAGPARLLKENVSARKAVSQKQEAYESLKNWIIYTDLRPGTPLKERELAKLFGISRTPLREVLQRLSYQHLVVIRPRKGIFVAPIDYINLRSTFEVRAPVEAKAASLAARRASPDEVESLQEIVDLSTQRRTRGDVKEVIRFDQMFHERLGDLSRNPVLKKMIEDLHNVCLRFWYLSIDSIPEDYTGLEDLGPIVEAIRKRDCGLAAELNERHVMRFLSLFE
ncbi:MAG: GntR family transcriptional regulator [Deltaproteobacteria bacterium]|nr:GntR family transcriptional regulator [Deltaproteobacteria bacterium]